MPFSAVILPVPAEALPSDKVKPVAPVMVVVGGVLAPLERRLRAVTLDPRVSVLFPVAALKIALSPFEKVEPLQLAVVVFQVVLDVAAQMRSAARACCADNERAMIERAARMGWDLMFME